MVHPSPIVHVYQDKFFTPENPVISNVHFWAKYVDDVFCILKDTERQLSLFCALLNSIYPDIKFSFEIEFNKQLHFLDLISTRTLENLYFNIYRKPTSNDTCILVDSYQSSNIRLPSFHSMIHGVVNIPLPTSNFKQEY